MKLSSCGRYTSLSDGAWRWEVRTKSLKLRDGLGFGGVGGVGGGLARRVDIEVVGGRSPV